MLLMRILFKKLIWSFVIFISLTILALLLIPLIYKKDLEGLVRASINSKINGNFDFESVDIGLLSTFPNVSIQVNDPLLTSFVMQDSNKIFYAESFTLKFNLIELFFSKGRYNIHTILFQSPNVYFQTYSDSLTNYSIFESATKVDSTQDPELEFSIEKFEILNGSFHYSTFENQDIVLEGLELSVKMNITKNLKSIQQVLDITGMTVKSNSVTLLDSVPVQLQTDLKFYDKEQKLEILSNSLEISKIKLQLKGFLEYKPDSSIFIAVELNSMDNQVKDLISLLAPQYHGDWDKVSSKGKLSMEGRLNGSYHEGKELFPDFKFNLNLTDGYVQFPGSSLDMSRINIDLKMEDSGGKFKNTKVNCNHFEFYLNSKKFYTGFNIYDLQQDFYGDLKVQGSFELNDWKSFIPIGNGNEIYGNLSADIVSIFNKSDIESGNIENLNLKGSLELNNFIYKKDFEPEISIQALNCFFENKVMSFSGQDIKYGTSDLSLHGKLQDPLNLLSDNRVAILDLNIAGKNLNLIEVMGGEDQSDTVTTVWDGTGIASNPGIESQLSINSTSKFNKVLYEGYDISEVDAIINWNNGILRLDRIKAVLNGNEMIMSGQFEKLLPYLDNVERLNGNLNISGNSIDVFRFMNYPGSSNTTNSSIDTLPFTVPVGMDITIKFNFGSLKYDQWEFFKPSGKLLVTDHELQIHNFNSLTLGGDISLQGLYNSSNPLKPAFDIKYDMSKMDFKKSFESIKSLKILAPIFKFIEGSYNSSLVCSGNLNSDMSIDFNSFNLNGLIETLNGVIKSYPPLEQVSTKLGVSELSSIALENSKNWINVDQGRLTLKPGEKIKSDIKIKYQGSHEILGEMDYKFIFSIPRSKIKNTSVGNSIESGLNFVDGLMAKSGFKLRSGETINVGVDLKGKFLKPTIEFRIKKSSEWEAPGEEKSTAENIKIQLEDSLKRVGESTAMKVKDKVVDKTSQITDSVKTYMGQKIKDEKDIIINQATDELKKKLDSNIVDEGKKILGDKVGSEIDKVIKGNSNIQTDSIKAKVKEWNPFKKKKN